MSHFFKGNMKTGDEILEIMKNCHYEQRCMDATGAEQRNTGTCGRGSSYPSTTLSLHSFPSRPLLSSSWRPLLNRPVLFASAIWTSGVLHSSAPRSLPISAYLALLIAVALFFSLNVPVFLSFNPDCCFEIKAHRSQIRFLLFFPMYVCLFVCFGCTLFNHRFLTFFLWGFKLSIDWTWSCVTVSCISSPPKKKKLNTNIIRNQPQGHVIVPNLEICQGMNFTDMLLQFPLHILIARGRA